MAVVAALGAAVLYALASVLQQRAAAQQPREQALRVGLLLGLLGRRMWLAGIAADVAGFVLQFAALTVGSLVLVQPLLVSGLLFAVPLSVAMHRRRPTAVDWTGSALVVAGLAVFLVVAQPGPGSSDISAGAWAVLLPATLVPALALAVLARGAAGATSAGLLAAGGGVIYGVSAALTKVVGHLLGGGVLHALSSWQPYVLVVLGLGGMLVVQSAFQAGPLAWSLPTLTVVDPVVSILIGAFAFGEHIGRGPLSSVLEIAGLSAVVVGVFTLARSPWAPGAAEGAGDAHDGGAGEAPDGDAGVRPPLASGGGPEAGAQPRAVVGATARPRSESTGPMRSSKLSQ